MSCGCTCSTTISATDPGKGATTGDFNRSRSPRAAEARRVPYVILDRAASVGAGTSDALMRCIGLSLHPFVRRWRRPASCWTRKAPCSRTRTIRTRSRCSIPRSRAKPIASPIGSLSPDRSHPSSWESSTGARTRPHLGPAHLPGFVQEGAVIDLRPCDLAREVRSRHVGHVLPVTPTRWSPAALTSRHRPRG